MNNPTEIPYAEADAVACLAVDSQAVAVQRKQLRVVCALHLLAAWIAAVLATYEVETILATFVLVLGTGSWVIVLARRRSSWSLLSYGNSSFWVVAMISLTIATFDLSPAKAVPVVPAMLVVYALLLTGWLYRINCSLFVNPAQALASRPPIRFSLRSMMILTTAMCVLAALARFVPYKNDNWIFGLGGCALLGISGLITFRYLRPSLPSTFD